jgi:hypothetical protein
MNNEEIIKKWNTTLKASGIIIEEYLETLCLTLEEYSKKEGNYNSKKFSKGYLTNTNNQHTPFDVVVDNIALPFTIILINLIQLHPTKIADLITNVESVYKQYTDAIKAVVVDEVKNIIESDGDYVSHINQRIISQLRFGFGLK